MVNAKIEQNDFVTHGRTPTKKSLSQSVLKRQAFLREHDFQISIDPATDEVSVKVIRRKT